MKRVVLNYLVIAPLAVSAVFISCSKSVSDEDFGEVQLPKTIINTGPRYYDRYEYKYDSQNRITKVLMYYNHELFLPEAVLRETHTFTYIGDDFVKVVEERTNSGTGTVEISKNGNKVNVTRKYSSGEIQYTATMDLNNDGYPTKRESSFTFGTNNWQVETYQFRNGNLMKSSVLRGNGPNSNSEYTYDNKKSPFFYCETPKWVMFNLFLYYDINKNNLIRNYWGEGKTDYTEYKYEYTDGLPVKRTMKYASGEEYVTEYIYK